MSGKLTLCKLLAKKEEKLGQGEKIMDDCGGFIVFLNYRFSETEILIDHQLVNPSTKKTSQSQRSPIFTVAQTFVPRDEQTALQFPMEIEVFKEAYKRFTA